jgi:hypothetical protein
VQYRRNDTESLNVFPNLGGNTINMSLSAPIALTVVRGRTIQNINFGFTHATVNTTNAFSGVKNVAGEAGINYPSSASSSPLNWGVPNLTLSGYTGVSAVPASSRNNDRFTTSYNWIRPSGRHLLRFGGDYRVTTSEFTVNSNPLGTYTFTGLYASAGSQVAGTSGAGFADFLLGLPQQASLQVGNIAQIRQRSFDAYFQDNWQRSAKLTLNLGVRYELVNPYVEVDGRMTNLDAPPDFSAAVPVVAGGVGPFSGAFPAGLLNTDWHTVGPRIGMAYRLAPRTLLRAGYSITYNSNTYASVANQLVAQPPFAATQTVIGTTEAPLTLADAFLQSTEATTNNYGVDLNYAVGTIQTWNATLSRDIGPNWNISAGYTGTKGTDLDILRAPNRGPDGLLIPDVQAFTWESSGGNSILNAGVFQVRRKLAGGVSGDLSYTLARSMDNASSLGSPQPIVAQNDKDLGAEWALSNFDRRHQVSGDFLVELPFGRNRRWLNHNGLIPTIVGEWSASFTVTVQSGTPYTARVLGATADVSRGTNGSLRANYNGLPIQLPDPMVDAFFNTAAFGVPPIGVFGDAARNTIIGPGTHQLNAQLLRDIGLSSTRVLTLTVNATNLLNTVQWASIDTNVNSPTYGQVIAAKPMRAVTASARYRF